MDTEQTVGQAASSQADAAAPATNGHRDAPAANESSPAESSHVEPSPAESGSTESGPTESSPTESGTVDVARVEPARAPSQAAADSSTAAPPVRALPGEPADASTVAPAKRGRHRKRRLARRLAGRTLGKAWDDSIFSMAAQAAFWQALSLPPLFLALLGSLSYVGDWFGPEIVHAAEQRIIEFSERVFNPEVVDQIIAPTAESILTGARLDVISVGFVIALWAGSSAVASLVDSITEAHNQYEVRHPVIQRLVSLLIYLVGLLVSIIGLPLLALGPELLPQVLPESWRATAARIIDGFYYPVVGLLIVIVLTTLYKIAVPRVGPWRRLLPGALLAMVVFLSTATGLRIYISWITGTGYTYGALATPIAFLLFAFLIGFAIVLGAYLNNTIEELWPSRLSRRQRRVRRMLSMRRLAERLRSDAGPTSSSPA